MLDKNRPDGGNTSQECLNIAGAISTNLVVACPHTFPDNHFLEGMEKKILRSITLINLGQYEGKVRIRIANGQGSQCH